MNAKLLGLVGVVTLLLGACSRTCDIESETKPEPGSAEDFNLNTKTTVYFRFDDASLTPSAEKRAESQACWLNAYPDKNVTIEGYTDIRGTTEYNLALGKARANTVSKKLQASGVSKDRITVISYGKERVADTGTTEEAHAKNRRTVTVVE